MVWGKVKEVFGIGIENNRFIDLFISFGLSKKSYEEGWGKKAFEWFNSLCWTVDELDLKKNNFPKGIKPKVEEREIAHKLKGLDYGYIAYDGQISKHLWLPAKVYVRSKKFNLSKSEDSRVVKIEDNKMEMEESDGKTIVKFVPESFYSPREFGKDFFFLSQFNELISEEFSLEKFIARGLDYKDGEIYVGEKHGVIEFYYPLRKRVRLYKKNKKLDKFIFREDLGKVLNSKELSGSEKGIKKEARRVFKEGGRE